MKEDLKKVSVPPKLYNPEEKVEQLPSLTSIGSRRGARKSVQPRTLIDVVTDEHEKSDEIEMGSIKIEKDVEDDEEFDNETSEEDEVEEQDSESNYSSEE